MTRRLMSGVSILAILIILISACSPTAGNSRRTPIDNQESGKKTVLAVESFLGDIASNVAGNHLHISTLIPVGMDPHNYDPTPQDIVRLTRSELIIINGAGYESWLNRTLTAVALEPDRILAASDGLAPRVVDGETDPHFWLDPTLVIKYVENIREAFIRLDPDSAGDFRKNADAYIASLNDLDQWIRTKVDEIPPEKRLLVTNHESFGYFIDRYGFQPAGSILPSPNSDASPSARQLVGLVNTIRISQIKAVFIEAGANARIADQIAAESGVIVITDLYTESLSPPNGPASNYIDLMKYDTKRIVDSLK